MSRTSVNHGEERKDGSFRATADDDRQAIGESLDCDLLLQGGQVLSGQGQTESDQQQQKTGSEVPRPSLGCQPEWIAHFVSTVSRAVLGIAPDGLRRRILPQAIHCTSRKVMSGGIGLKGT